MIPTGTQISLIDNDAADPIIGFFSNAPEGASLNVNGTTFQITYMGGTNNNDVVLTATGTLPSVTIDQSAGQADPTNVSPINSATISRSRFAGIPVYSNPPLCFPHSWASNERQACGPR